MGLVLRADRRHPGRLVEVVAAVGHAEAALEQIGRVARRVVQVLLDPEAEHVVGVEVGRVQGIDVGAELLAERRGQRVRVGDLRDAPEHRRQRLETVRLDGRLVHERGVVVADLLRLRRRRSRRLFEQLRGPLLHGVGQALADAGAAAIGRDLRLREPGAVGVEEEVVAGLHRAVHRVEIERVTGDGRHRRRDRRQRDDRRGRRRDGSDRVAAASGEAENDGEARDAERHGAFSGPHPRRNRAGRVSRSTADELTRP